MPKTARTPALPQSLRTIAAAIGDEKTLELVSKLGGTIVYIPVNPGPDCRLVNAVGMATAVKLAKEMGAGHVNLPLASKAVTFWMHSLGKSNNEIAIAQRITADTVSRRLNGKSKPPKKQMDLFAAE
jgi:hypothetical protein